MTNLDGVFKKQTSLDQQRSKAMVFPVVTYAYESWTRKKAERFQIVVLKKTLESPLDYKEVKLVNPKGNQPWLFIGRTDAETEAPIFWAPDT